jgi:hypothetical protein
MAEDDQGFWGSMLGVILAAAAVVLVGLLVYRVYPGTLPRDPKPGYLDDVVLNGPVLFVVRLAVIVVFAAVAVFIASSVVVRMRAGEYLSEVGSFKTQARELSSKLEERDEMVWRLFERNERLEERLEEARMGD